MEPRLKTSKKWTSLPKDFLSQIRAALKENFALQIGKGQVEVDGRIYPEEIVIRVGYRTPGTLKQRSWDVSLAYKKDKEPVLKVLHLAVDAGAALFDQLFSAESDEDFPRLWQEIDFEGRKIHIQYTTVNSKLETEADRLLGLKNDELAQGEWDAEVDAELVKAGLGIDPEDEEFAEDFADDDEDESPKAKVPPKKH